MPEPLWQAAVALAGRQGVYRTSQELGVNYDSLKARLRRGSRVVVARASRASKVQPKSASAARPRFVELEAAPGVAKAMPEPAAMMIEVEDATGMKLTIRLGAEQVVDVAAVVGAFRSVTRQATRG